MAGEPASDKIINTNPMRTSLHLGSASARLTCDSRTCFRGGLDASIPSIMGRIVGRKCREIASCGSPSTGNPLSLRWLQRDPRRQRAPRKVADWPVRVVEEPDAT